MDPNGPRKVTLDKSEDSESLSLTPPLPGSEMSSDSFDNSISEHLDFQSDQIEHDRSDQEIEISNLPSNFSLTFENLNAEDEHISQEDKPSSLINSKSSDTSISLRNNLVAANMQNILDEILKSDQFKSDYSEESFNVFGNVNLNDSLVNVEENNKETIKQLEELLESKEKAITALAAEVESLKELNGSNHSTLSLNTSSTEYKQYQGELQLKTAEFQNALAYRDGIIEKLTEALEVSNAKREELEQKGELLADEVQFLSKKIQEVQVEKLQSSIPMEMDEKDMSQAQKDLEFDTICSELENTLNNSQLELMHDLKSIINEYVEKKVNEKAQIMEGKLEKERIDHELEVLRLRELLSSIKCDSINIIELRQELEAKHTKEMEELRTYFEQKCSDLEKHYSEDINSQHSRRMSGSSTNSEQDFFLSNQPQLGPGGDNEVEDYEKIKSTIRKLAQKLNEFDLENISIDQIGTITNVLSFFPNKADLASLREDYENKMDIMHAEYTSRIENLEKQYEDKIDSLKYELESTLKNVDVHVSTAVQEVASSGEYELAEVVQSYERRLQEQVNLAKLDLINSLEHQIQMLVADTTDQGEWPTELKQLKKRFAEKYEQEIEDMRNRHDSEIAKLKEEHLKNLNGAIERAKRRSLRGDEFFDEDLITERDSYKRKIESLHLLLVNLLQYVNDCEDELNNTLFEQLLLKLDSETDLNLNDSSNSTSSESNKRRVHFAPQIEEVMAAIAKANADNVDVSTEVKNELESCLARLRNDANAILVLSSLRRNNEEEKLVGDEEPIRRELKETQSLVKYLEAEKETLEEQLEEFVKKQTVLEADLRNCKEKIGELIESAHKEIVSVGYGEGLKNFGEKLTTLNELQEKARNLLSTEGNSSNPELHLIDQLCREADHIKDEARKDQEDLYQQIEAADKKLRATCHFLEEQAAEREQERDEAQKEILSLKEQLKERDKERINYERINREVEQVERQMREMSKLIEASANREKEIETERDEAVDKILVLRDIIKDLESQVESKIEHEVELTEVISKLEEIVKQQSKSHEELHQQLESFRNGTEYQEEIERLRDEVQRLGLNSEFGGNEGALKQFRLQLSDIEATLDKKTRNLEILHSSLSATACSSPSEDMSVRDQIRPRTPNPMEECDLPLQQLARLKEKLIKHSRAEDAAVKRIHDLEMQFEAMKRDLDDVQNERDLLQDQVSDQLLMISSLQIRLDDQRLRAEQVQKQTNTSLEVRIYDLEQEIKNLMETVRNKDKTIKQLNKTVEETNKRLADLEKDLNSKADEDLIADYQNRIDQLNFENTTLKLKIDQDMKNAQVLPGLVDNIIADKNKDIEILREKLDKTQEELNSYLSLNLDCDQLKALSKMQSSDRAFADILSLIIDEPDQIRKVEHNEESLMSSMNVPYKRNANETIFLGSGREISSIEQIGPSNVNLTPEAPLPKPNSTEIEKFDKHVRFEDSFNDELKKQVEEKNKVVKDLEEKMKETREECEKELQELRVDLAESKMKLLDKEQEFVLLQEDGTRKDKMYLDLSREKRDLEKIIADLRQDTERYKEYDQTMIEKNKQIYRLEEELLKIKECSSNIEEIEVRLKEKTLEVDNLQKLLKETEESLKKRVEKLEESESKYKKDLRNKESQLNLMNSELEEKNRQLAALQNSKEEMQEKLSLSLEAQIKDLKAIIHDRETEIEILNEDAARYLDDIANLESKLVEESAKIRKEYELKLAENMKEIEHRKLEISKLNTHADDTNRKMHHLQDLINEKDKIINQMSLDTKRLHVNLETIQNKILESGNIIDLRKLLTQEQQLNATLKDQVEDLKGALRSSELKNSNLSLSMDGITGQVQKEIDYSDQLDSSIINALNSGNFQMKSIPNTTDSHILKDALKKERSLTLHLIKTKERLQEELRQIEIKCEKEKENGRRLLIYLENEKQNSNTIQLEDANIMRQLRMRLETAVENESEFERQLEKEKKIRNGLQLQLDSLKKKAAFFSSGENSKTESTQYKSLPNFESQELFRLRTNLQSLQEENGKLKEEMKVLKRLRNESDSNLKYAKDMLDLKVEQVEKLTERIEELGEAEIAMRDKWLSVKVELDNKTREVENSRMLLTELDQERIGMKKEIERLKLGEHDEAKAPEQFLSQLKDLHGLLKENMKDNKKLSKTIDKLNEEKQVLQERIQGSNEGKLLLDDPMSRANYVFGRYLRAESYRKALVFQKRWLIKLLATYQECIAYNAIKDVPFRANTKNSRGIKRFKIAAICIQSIIRIQHTVRRWHSGIRGMSYANLKPRRVITQDFRIGQPVSSQVFFQSVAGATRETNRTEMSLGPWTGITPPSKEKKPRNENSRTVQTPVLLSQYFEKFDRMQEMFDVTVETDST